MGLLMDNLAQSMLLAAGTRVRRGHMRMRVDIQTS